MGVDRDGAHLYDHLVAINGPGDFVCHLFDIGEIGVALFGGRCSNRYEDGVGCLYCRAEILGEAEPYLRVFR